MHIAIAARPGLLADLGFAYSSGAIHSTPVGLAASSVDNANSQSIASTTTIPYPNTLGVVPNLQFAGNKDVYKRQAGRRLPADDLVSSGRRGWPDQ